MGSHLGTAFTFGMTLGYFTYSITDATLSAVGTVQLVEILPTAAIPADIGDSMSLDGTWRFYFENTNYNFGTPPNVVLIAESDDIPMTPGDRLLEILRRTEIGRIDLFQCFVVALFPMADQVSVELARPAQPTFEKGELQGWETPRDSAHEKRI